MGDRDPMRHIQDDIKDIKGRLQQLEESHKKTVERINNLASCAKIIRDALEEIRNLLKKKIQNMKIILSQFGRAVLALLIMFISVLLVDRFLFISFSNKENTILPKNPDVLLPIFFIIVKAGVLVAIFYIIIKYVFSED